MTIIRTVFAPGDNERAKHQAFNDPALSMREIGLLARLLSYPFGYAGNAATLADDFRCGRDQIRGAMRGLSEAGYMRLLKMRIPSGGLSSAWFVCATKGHLCSPEFMRQHPTAIASTGGAAQ